MKINSESHGMIKKSWPNNDGIQSGTSTHGILL